VLIEAMVHDVIADHGRSGRVSEKLHARHFGRTTRFALIAGLAGAYDVVPGVYAPEAARHNMVYREFFGLPAAVLTGEIVSHKNFAAA
jgi:hypothetical protein